MSTSAHSYSPDTFAPNSRGVHCTSTLPHGLRAEAEGMSFAEIAQTYSPTSGPIRLGSTECSPYGAGRFEYTATLAIGDTIRSATVVSHGPADAITTMLYDAGINLEILSFHQRSTDDGYVTYVHGRQGFRDAWGMGTGATATTATAEALVAAANRIQSC